MKQLLKTGASLLLVVALLASLSVPVLAAPETENSESDNNIVRTSKTTLTKMEQQGYYNNIIAQMNALISQCKEQLKRDQPDAGSILEPYAEAAILADWLTYNFYVEGDVDDPEGLTQYSLFEVPGNIQPSRSNAEAVTVLNELQALHENIVSSSAFNTEVNWSQSKFNELEGFGSGSLTLSGSNISGGGSFTSRTGYYNQVASIVNGFIDGHIAAALIKSESTLSDYAGDTNTSGSSMSDNVSSALDIGDDKEQIASLVKKNKEELMPYLKMINEINSAYITQRSIGLEEFDFEGKHYSAFHYEKRPGLLMPTEYLSSLSYSMWEVAFSAASDVSKDETEDLISDVELTDTALSMMSNCNIAQGKIILPAGGEDGDKPEMNKLGYTILAAGTSYDPFVSKAGDDSFMAIIDSFLESGEDKDKIRQILKVAINTKKPLYLVEGKKSAWHKADSLEEIPIGDYRLAYLRDALDIDKDITRAYTVIKGQMTPSAVDSSTWEYTNYGTVNGEQGGNVTGVAIEDQNKDGTVASNTSDGTTIAGMKMVGSEEITASSDDVVIPVMITSGRSEFSLRDMSLTLDAFGFPAKVGGMTSVIIHNAAIDAKGHEAIQRSDREMLYLNGLGDIVLSDNTIVLPAIANPAMYDYGTDFDGLELEEFYELFTDGSKQVHAYYPYSAAFMNHYPTATIGTNGKMDVGAANDLDKFLICVEKGKVYAKRIKSVGDSAKLTATGGVIVSNIAASTFDVKPADSREAMSVLVIAEGGAGFNWHNVANGTFFAGYVSATGNILWNAAKSLVTGGNQGDVGGAVNDLLRGSATLMITQGTALNGANYPFFPLTNSSPDIQYSFLSVAAPLTTSAMRYISKTEEVTGKKASTGTFLVEHYLTDMCGEALLGTQYSETLEKNYQISYDDLVKDTGGRFLQFLIQVCNNAIEYLGRIDGVLAIKDPYSNSFFNAVVQFVQQFYLLIAAGLMIIVASKFMKGHYNMLYVCFLGFLCVTGFQAYANWLPTLVPSVYNFAVNDAIEDIVWNTVAYQVEQYDETYRDSKRFDPATGNLKPYTATVTLYTLSDAEMETLSVQTGASEEDVRSGTQIFLDNDAGIFIQGNQIKMSIDRLFASNSMRGLYQTQWEQLGADIESDVFIPPINEASNNNPYSIQLIAPYVSLEAYYTPYDHIERTFMRNLNTFANIFRVPRKQYTYDNGTFYKDAFLVQAYLHSAIFTAPGDTEILLENIDQYSISGLYTTDTIIDMCNYYFKFSTEPENIDWLNVREVFWDPVTGGPNEGLKDSLWGYLMQYRDWYDNNWNLTERGKEKISDLIEYINNQTKVWVIKNEQQLNYLSDENAIKLISLYATTCFTHYVSEFGQWLYPNYINAADIELQDVLYGSMTTLKDRVQAYDGDVVNTVALNNGIFGIIFLLLIVIFSTVFVFIVTYLIPILYALFGAILVYKLINDADGVGLVKGYVKVTLVTAILYFIFSLSLKMVRLGGYNWYGYLGCALIMMLCVYFLFWVCLSVVQDAGELGNNTLTNNLLRGLDKITRGAVQNLSVQTTRIYDGANRSYNRYGGTMQYGRHYNIDNYGAPVGTRRGMDSGGGYSGYGDYETSRQRRSPFRGFGRRDMYEDDFGTPRRDFYGTGPGGILGRRRGWNTSSRRGASYQDSDK